MGAGLGEKREIPALIEAGYSWRDLVQAVGGERATSRAALEFPTVTIDSLLDIGAPSVLVAKCSLGLEDSAARLKELMQAGVSTKRVA